MKPPYAYGDTTGSTRRTMLRRAAATAMLGPLFKVTPGIVSAQQTVNRNSAPSKLRITDMRACRVAANYDYPIVKIYTNQDVYGLGEVRDAGVEGIALILKAHLLGKDPLDIVGNLRPLRQFAGHARMGGGYSAVDMALHDISGKVFNVPAYRLVGSKVRDKIRIYADTTDHKDPKVYAERMRRRKEMGLTYFKMDLHTELVAERPGAVNERGVATEKGLGYLCEFIEAIRDVIGWGHAAGRGPFRPVERPRCHSLCAGVREISAFVGRRHGAVDQLAGPQGDQGEYHYSHTDRRGCVRPAQRIRRHARQPGCGSDPSGYRDLGRVAGDQTDRGLRRVEGHRHGDASCGIAGGRIRGLSHRRHIWEFRGHGEPRAGYALVAGYSEGRPEADHRQGLCGRA